MPAFRQEINLDMGGDLHDILAHYGLVFDVRNHCAYRGSGFGCRAGLVLCRLPKLLELLVGQEHAAVLFLEHAAEFLVGNVDLLLAERAVRLGVGVGLGGIGRRRGSRLVERFVGRLVGLAFAVRRQGRGQEYTSHNGECRE